MLINRECDYAFRIVRNLSPERVTSVGTIAKSECITNAIAYKVARKLERGGLIRSVRGNTGGYKLLRSLDELTMLDVYNVMQPETFVNECLKEGHKCPMNGDKTPCRIHCELQRIQLLLCEELASKTLREILED